VPRRYTRLRQCGGGLAGKRNELQKGREQG
jgi:hypothetical protein